MATSVEVDVSTAAIADATEVGISDEAGTVVSVKVPVAGTYRSDPERASGRRPQRQGAVEIGDDSGLAEAVAVDLATTGIGPTAVWQLLDVKLAEAAVWAIQKPTF